MWWRTLSLFCDMSLFDPDALECLAAIVEEGGFERAAVRLSITQSAVSQRLRSLEVQVGTVLIVRSRPLRATTAGRLLLKHAMQMRLLHADLGRELKELAPGASGNERDDAPTSIAINADSIATWVLPALSRLACQGLALEIITDDQDFTFDWLREGRVLGCVTTLAATLRGCKVEALGAMRYVAVATPEFAQAHCPDGLTPHNFSHLPFVAFNRKDDLQAEFVASACGLKQVLLRQLFVPSSEGQVQAVLAGWGASVLPEMKVLTDLQAGRLVNIRPDHHLAVALYWHCWNLNSALLDALTQALSSSAARVLTPVNARPARKPGRRAPSGQ